MMACGKAGPPQAPGTAGSSAQRVGRFWRHEGMRRQQRSRLIAVALLAGAWPVLVAGCAPAVPAGSPSSASSAAGATGAGTASRSTGAAASAGPVTANLPVVSWLAGDLRLAGQRHGRMHRDTQCLSLLVRAAVAATLNPGPQLPSGRRWGCRRAPAASPSMQVTLFSVPELITASAAAITPHGDNFADALLRPRCGSASG